MNKHATHPELFDPLGKQYHLSPDKIDLFYQYAQLLDEATCNVTTIRTLADIVSYHFADSLELGQALQLCNQTIIDVGSGGGFPGIPLKIAYPNCQLILIEVCAKKRAFLQEVINKLNLSGITIEEKDWRTFLRSTRYSVDVVCARASLAPHELLRMFQPSSPYKQASLVYWASSLWEPSEKERTLLHKIYPYQVGDRQRKLAFFHIV